MAGKQAVEIVVVLDRSGSMAAIWDDAIGGFNAFLEEQQKAKGKANLTLIQFDHEYEVKYGSLDVKNVVPLDKASYVPRGMTAMWDAMGRALSDLKAKAPKRAIIAILTDGQENASKEFTSAQVKALIKEAGNNDWEVLYLSADANALQDASNLGISAINTTLFKNDRAGTQSAYATMNSTTLSYRSNS